MLSLQKKFIFIHVPKTAGDSIQSVLRGYSEDVSTTLMHNPDGIDRFVVKNDKLNTDKHSTLTRYKSALDSKTYRSLFKFSVIRNPWDRLMSSYFYSRRNQEWDREYFLSLVHGIPPLRFYISERSFLERSLWKLGIYTHIGTKKMDADIDFLIRFEHINDDFRLVCEKLDIPFSPLSKKNSSKHEHYSKYYDGELKEIVYRKYREEIVFGNYDF